MSPPPINVGIIGYGLSAKIFHIPFVTAVPAFHLHAIVQRNPTPENDASKDHPEAHIHPSPDSLLADPSIALVVITTPPATHFALASAALEAKKHVLVEKPFTPTSAEAAALVALAHTHSRLLSVYQNRRHDADFASLSALIRAGALGRVVEFESHFDRHRPVVAGARSWKYQAATPGTGVIYDLGSHLLDQAVHLFGKPDRITGFLVNQRNDGSGLLDSCTVLLHYADGAKPLVTIKAGVMSAEVKQLRFWVRGTEGSYRKYHLDVQEEQLLAGLRPGGEGYGVEAAERRGVVTCVGEGGKIERRGVAESEQVPPPPTYVEFYRRLGAALASGKEEDLPVSGEEATLVIRLIELALQSSREGRTLSVE